MAKVIIEEAINSVALRKSANPNVPYDSAEIALDAIASSNGGAAAFGGSNPPLSAILFLGISKRNPACSSSGTVLGTVFSDSGRRSLAADRPQHRIALD